MRLSPLVATATPEELAFIAALDYGQDADRHLRALRETIFEQHGALRSDQHWHPYEVIELGANALVPGHPREFAICTLLVLHAVATGYDTATDLAFKFETLAADYDALPTGLRDEVLRAYAAAQPQP